MKEAQTLARHSTPVLTTNTYSRTGLVDLAGAVAGVGDLLTQPVRQNPEAQRATGTDGRANQSAAVDHKLQASHGTGWHSGASVRAADHSEPSAAENEKTPEKPGTIGTSRGFSAQRLRSESNRRWRICNPLP